MLLFGRWRCESLRLTVAGAILGVLLLSPARATASCGDYLVPPPGSDSVQAASPEHVGGEPFLAHAPAAPLPLKPCSGPGCSSAPSLPFSIPATAPTLSEQPTLPNVHFQLLDCRSDALPLPGTVMQLSCGHTAIWHPPRDKFLAF
jgi:hypothetical protein